MHTNYIPIKCKQQSPLNVKCKWLVVDLARDYYAEFRRNPILPPVNHLNLSLKCISQANTKPSVPFKKQVGLGWISDSTGLSGIRQGVPDNPASGKKTRSGPTLIWEVKERIKVKCTDVSGDQLSRRKWNRLKARQREAEILSEGEGFFSSLINIDQ